LSATARWRRAWRYAAGTWTENDADMIAFEAHDRAGYWPLETIDVEGLEGIAQATWGDVPELSALAHSAAATVARKWDSGGGHQRHAAEEWAMELIAEYAKEDGVELIEADA